MTIGVRPLGYQILLVGVIGLAACTSARETTPLRFVEAGLTLDSANSQCVAGADIDLDGDVDILVANDDAASVVWINDGAAGFTASAQEFPSANCVVLSDLDDDGDADAIFASDQTVVLLNDGTGGFAQVGGTLSSPAAGGTAVGDVDGDGAVDVVISTWGHPTGLPNQVWLGDGAGLYALSSSTVGTAVSIDLALGDVDADGDLDVLVANQADANHDPIPDELWLNDGVGNFADSGLRLGRSSTNAVRLADLDGDGDLDAMAANSSHAGKSEPANRVWYNDGDGNLIDSGQRLGDAYSLCLELVDLDNDGDLDAYVGNYQREDRIWLNDGSGRFTDSGLRLGTQNGHGVVLADLDGDGDIDAFVVNNTWQAGDGRNRVWLNSR